MKTSIRVFARDTYQSGTGGAARTYRCADDVRKAIGAAKSVRFQVIGYRKSANARVTVSLWETPHPDLRPSEVIPGGAAFFVSSPITALRPSPVAITGPFCTNCEMTIDIDEATPTSLQEFDLEMWATLIFEE